MTFVLSQNWKLAALLKLYIMRILVQKCWIFVEFTTATFGIAILSLFIFMTRPFAPPFQRLSCNSKVSFFAHCVLHASLFVGYFSCHNFRVQCQVQFWKRALFAWSNYFTEYCFKTIPPSEVPYWAICTKTPLKKLNLSAESIWNSLTYITPGFIVNVHAVT